MTRGGIKDSLDSDEEPQPDLSYQPSAEGSTPAVDGASALPCPESLEHEPLASRPPGVLCSSPDDLGRPVGHHMISGPSIIRSEPQVSNLSRVDSAGSSGLPLVSIPQIVRPCEFSSSRTGAFGQSGPTLSFPLQVRSSVTGSSAQFAQLPQTQRQTDQGGSQQVRGLPKQQVPLLSGRLAEVPCSVTSLPPQYLEGNFATGPNVGPSSFPGPGHHVRGYGDQLSASGNSSHQLKQEPKVSLPFFAGKSEWRVFCFQFERMSRRFQWDEEVTLDRLVSTLREDALEQLAEETAEVRASLSLLVALLDHRFGDRTLPETYRASLQTLQKQPRESLEEYATRVRRMVSQAYPGIPNTRLLEDMTIEHLVSGLADHNLMYDVLTKKPQTVVAAMDLIQWHEGCKGIQRKWAGVCSLVPKPSGDDSANVHRVNGKAYITEEGFINSAEN